MKYNNELLIKIAQGDAFGLGVEYVKKPHSNYNNLLLFNHYYPHPRGGIISGSYTDDTQMSIAVAEVIIDGPPYTEEKFGKAFFNAYKRDPVKGYSSGLQNLLDTNDDYESFMSKLIPKSIQNGAAMRAVPIGVLNDPKDILEVAKIQASVTHNTPVGILSAQAIALASHYSLYNCGAFTQKDMSEWFVKYLPSAYIFFNKTPMTFPVEDPYVSLKTVQAVFDALMTQNNLLDILRYLVLLGGDTDSTCSIALGIASSKLTDKLPDFFETELAPNNKCNISFLRTLSEKLILPWYEKDLR